MCGRSHSWGATPLRCSPSAQSCLWRLNSSGPLFSPAFFWIVSWSVVVFWPLSSPRGFRNGAPALPSRLCRTDVPRLRRSLSSPTGSRAIWSARPRARHQCVSRLPCLCIEALPSWRAAKCCHGFGAKASDPRPCLGPFPSGSLGYGSGPSKYTLRLQAELQRVLALLWHLHKWA